MGGKEGKDGVENFLKIYYAFLTFLSRIKDFEGLKFRTSKLPYFPIWMNLVRWWYVWLPRISHKDSNNITAITALGNLFSVWFDENAACKHRGTRS